jgi:hypothetical protein
LLQVQEDENISIQMRANFGEVFVGTKSEMLQSGHLFGFPLMAQLHSSEISKMISAYKYIHAAAHPKKSERSAELSSSFCLLNNISDIQLSNTGKKTIELNHHKQQDLAVLVRRTLVKTWTCENE